MYTLIILITLFGVGNNDHAITSQELQITQPSREACLQNRFITVTRLLSTYEPTQYLAQTQVVGMCVNNETGEIE